MGENAGSEFTAEVYRAAAEEHLRGLEILYVHRRYVLALYIAGVAVEAIFRAYRCRINPAFDARHNLHALYRAAQFAELVPWQRREKYAAAIAGVATRWSNSHRYRSDAAVRAFLKRAKLDRGIHGDFLKENARRIINDASELVTLGLLRWKIS